MRKWLLIGLIMASMLSVSVVITSKTSIEGLIEDGDLKKAYTLLEDEASKKNQSDDDRIVAYRRLLEIDLFAENSEKLLEHSIELMRISEESEDAFAEMLAYYYLANTYYLNFDDTSAIDNIDIVKEIADSEDFELGQVLYHYFLGSVHFDYMEDDDAYEEFLLAWEYAESVDYDKYWIIYDHELLIDYILKAMEAEDHDTDEAVIEELVDIQKDITDENIYLSIVVGDYVSVLLAYYEADEECIQILESQRSIIDGFDLSEYFISHYINLNNFIAEEYYLIGDYKNSADALFRNPAELELEDDVDQTEAFNEALRFIETRQLEEETKRQRTIIVAITCLVLIMSLGIALILRGNFKIKQLNKSIYEKSIRDGLTGLYNHSKIVDLFIENAHKISAIAIIDIDHFKNVNDTYGHLRGDEVLRCLGEYLKDAMVNCGEVGRYGGEEFLVLFYEDEQQHIHQKVNRILKDVEAMKWSFKKEPITVSIGLLFKEIEDFNELFKMADELLYKAKSNGRNQICTKAFSRS